MSREFEHAILDVVREGIASHLQKRMSESYQSPLDPFLKSAIEKHAPEIGALYDSAVGDALKHADLRPALAAAFDHKLAKLLVSRFEGEIEKRANELRSDASFRAKVTLAIENAVMEVRK